MGLKDFLVNSERTVNWICAGFVVVGILLIAFAIWQSSSDAGAVTQSMLWIFGIGLAGCGAALYGYKWWTLKGLKSTYELSDAVIPGADIDFNPSSSQEVMQPVQQMQPEVYVPTLTQEQEQQNIDARLAALNVQQQEQQPVAAEFMDQNAVNTAAQVA